MEKLPVIDCDSHVEECEATWQHLDKRYWHRRPIHLDLHGTPGRSAQDSYWLIDGRTHPRPEGLAATIGGSPPSSTLGRSKSFSLASQTLDDVSARLADMDELGIQISVLFPTATLTHLTEDARYEAALMRSYNTWLAERCRQAPDRLKFGALVPLRSPEDAIAEVKRAKELGAVCVFSMGTAGEKMLDDESLDPVYEAMIRQGLPFTVHVGWSHPGLTASCNDLYAGFTVSFTLPVLMGFFSITAGGVLDRHPGLKVAFMEAGGDWLPFWVHRLDQYHPLTSALGRPVSNHKPSDYLKTGSIYFSVEGDEAGVPEVVNLLGEDHVMSSADIPHAEAREKHLEVMARREDLSAHVREKILTHNPARFYGLKI